MLINRSNPWARNGELDGQRNPPNEVLYVGEGVALEGQEARMAIRQWFSGVSRASVKRKSEDWQKSNYSLNYACLTVPYMFAVLLNWRNAFRPGDMAQWVKAGVPQARQHEVQLCKPHQQKDQLCEIVSWLLMRVSLPILNRIRLKMSPKISPSLSQWLEVVMKATEFRNWVASEQWFQFMATHIVSDPLPTEFMTAGVSCRRKCCPLKEMIVYAWESWYRSLQLFIPFTKHLRKQCQIGKHWP